jgi:UDP-N-acetylglucosamine--N-acetylmuramyl-(pentapeptide) pyrophosphoryl-undecaprenol N-acetylglucosamine transferase
VYPALAVVDALDKSAEILWVGGVGGMESSLVRRSELSFIGVPAAGVHGVGLRALPGNLLNLVRGVFAAMRILRDFRPDVLFFTGGFVGVPMSVAGWKLPKVLFVPDIAPALASRWISRTADVIAVVSERSRRHYREEKRVVVTGYPVRAELEGWDRANGRRALDLPEDEPVVLVFGGSRGARSINEALWLALPRLLRRAWVLHITGTLDWSRVKNALDHVPTELSDKYRPYAYLHEEMGQALAAADLVVSRAGAATMGEYPHFGLPALLVPYPHAWRYQEQNAAYLQERGAAQVLRDEDLGERLLPAIQSLLEDRARLREMSRAARALAADGAAEAIAQEIHDLAAVEGGEHG